MITKLNRILVIGFALLLIAAVTLTVFKWNAKGGQQPVNSAFPKMAPADMLYVYDIRQDSAEAKLSALALQGLINQDQAQIYVWTREADLDRSWLYASGKSYQFVPLLSGDNPGLRSLYRDYGSLVNKLIVWDGDKDWTFNLALMKGAVEGGLPVTNAVKDSLITEFGSKTVEDVRLNWVGRVDAYEWAIDNLLPSLDKRLLFSAGLREPDWRGYPWNVFDYAVASQSFTFYLDPRIPEEEEVMVKIIQEGGYPAGTPVLGYAPNADDLNDYTNPHGVGYVVSDFYSNGSVWSSFPNKTYAQPPSQPVEAEAGKVYVAITASDGDNLQYDQQLLNHFQSPAAGQVPVGITIAPVLRELGTPIMDYFYNRRGNNIELVAGPSGFQFIYPEKYAVSGYPSWLSQNKQWLIDAGIRTTQIWHSPLNSASHKQMAESLADSGVTGILRGDDARPINAHHGVYTVSQGNMVTQYGDIYSTLSSISADSSRPVFHTIYPILAFYGVDEHGNPAFFDHLKAEVDRLQAEFPGKYVFLKPQDLIATIDKLNRDIQGVSFTPNNTDRETIYMYEDFRSALDNGYRCADEDGYWIYRFDLADDAEQAILTMDISGDYAVELSKDGMNWSAAANAQGNPNRITIDSDVSGWLAGNPSKTIYVKFSDATPQDGGGPVLYGLTLSTAITQVSMLTPSYLDSQFLVYNTGAIDNGHRYADEDRQLIYKFNLTNHVSEATLTMDLAGNYVVDISTDGVNWSPAADAMGNLNRITISSDLSGWLANNAEKMIWVRFADKTPQDGHGPSVYHLSLAAF